MPTASYEYIKIGTPCTYDFVFKTTSKEMICFKIRNIENMYTRIRIEYIKEI